MKKKFLHITLSYFLLSSILLGQVVVNFFHDHEGHAHHIATKDGSVLSEHEEACKVCSLNVIHELYCSETVIAFEDFIFNTIAAVEAEDFKFTPFHFKAGRAPPVPVFQS